MKIFVQAKPSSKEESIEKVDEQNYIVRVKEPPVRGLANKAIVKALSIYFDGASVNIVAGYTSRNKIIEIWQK